MEDVATRSWNSRDELSVGAKPANEAAHVLQHSGQTGDAGLGAEGHAGAVADAVVAGR
ncbi:hypothetical protein Adu01nite_78600 [Paractinoplanes durhamensis]|uniref:Uncharacterized protein n=1 Tax=Paractinoplanes durhamensis TaxID=113563 RepID=A0ABQ3Z9M0_9ACTN|nr:hypothetical protein Adu01nite_78600 [Actinoplanes durhamensis]